MKEKRFLILCSLLLSLAVFLAACSSASTGSYSISPSTAKNYVTEGKTMTPAASSAAPATAQEAAMDMAMESPSMGGEVRDSSGILPDTLSLQALSDRKIVTTYDLTVETIEFDESVRYINQVIAEYGGYIESSSVQGKSIRYDDYNTRWAHFTLRIPAENIRQFVSMLGDKYNVTNTEERSDDITDSYYDSKARLASLEEQEKQLNRLLEQGGDLEYILEVHRELANVRYQIESLHSNIQRMDKSVNYSTARISLQEVMNYNPVDPMPMSFGERISQAVSNSWSNFTRSMQNSMIGFIYNLPFLIGNLITIAVLVFIVLFVRRAIRKRRGLGRGERTFSVWHSRKSFTEHPPTGSTSTPPQKPEDSEEK